MKINNPIRRYLQGSLWLKVSFITLLIMGVTEKWAAVTVTILMTVWTTHQIREGVREGYIEPYWEMAVRHWEDLVWSHTQWRNYVKGTRRYETPHEGIERLAGPFKVAATVGSSHETHVGARVVPTPHSHPHRPLGLGGNRQVARRAGLLSSVAHRSRGSVRPRVPEVARAPHELAIR